jgi:penicillin-binding protein 1C
MAPEAAFIVGDILADRGARSLTFGLENPLATRFWSAVKTGTSKDMRDNWCIGFSPRYTVGVWVGNFDGEPMRDVSGVSGAAPVWLEVMNRLHRGATPRPPRPPARLIQAQVDFPEGMEAPRSEWFLPGTEQGVISPAAAGALARIAYPAEGTLIVLDPDIPPERQRLLFHAMPLLEGMTWELDGVPVADPAWLPTPGRHELVLRDEAGRELDRVSFSVRGGPPAGPGR